MSIESGGTPTSESPSRLDEANEAGGDAVRCSVGHENPAGQRFCGTCGAPLETPNSSSKSTPPVAASSDTWSWPPPNQVAASNGPGNAPPSGSWTPQGQSQGGRVLQTTPQAATSDNGLAIAALVFAVLFWPVGIVLGHIARRRAARSGGSGRRMANAALIVGYVWGAIAIIVIVAVAAAANKTAKDLNTALNPAGAGAVDQPASPTPTSNQPTGPTQLTLGQSAPIVNETNQSPWGTVSVVSATSSQSPLTEFASRPANGYFVTFKIAGTGAAGITTSFDINPFDFYVLEPDGSHYDQSSGNALENEPDPQLNATSLNGGENVSGNVTYDVPAPHGELVYAPNLNGAPVAEWSF